MAKSMKNLFAGLVTPATLRDPDDGRDLFAMIEDVVPAWAAGKLGDEEPLRRPFDADHIEEVWGTGDEAWLLWWKSRQPGVASGTVFRRKRLIGHASLEFEAQPSSVDAGPLAELLCRLAVRFRADWGFAHLLTPPDTIGVHDPGVKPIASLHDGEPWMGIDDVTLRLCVPELYWANVFGAPYVKLFGADRLASAPAHLVKQIGPEMFYLQLSESPRDLVDHFDQITQARAELKAHLGIDAFWDPRVGDRGTYRAADLTRVPDLAMFQRAAKGHDAVVFAAPTTTKVAEVVEAWDEFCRTGRSAVFPPDRGRLEAFLVDLFASYPEEADDVAADLPSTGATASPWRYPLRVNDSYLELNMRGPRAAEVTPAIITLAHRHGLSVYDGHPGRLNQPANLPAADHDAALEPRS